MFLNNFLFSKQMKNIALINLPSPFLINERVFPNLGLIQLATSQIKRGYNAEIIDLCGSKDLVGDLEKIASNFDIFGMSSTTPQFVEAYKVNNILKKLNPAAKTILGGAHPSALYSLVKLGKTSDINLKTLENFDNIVVGEAENLNLTDLKEKWTVAPLIKEISEEPIPNRNLVDIMSYNYFLKGKPTTTIMTQRGCPFKCDFCCGREIDMYRKSRQKSAKMVLDELDYLNSEFGFDSFMWFDDELNVNKNHLFELSKKLKHRNYQHRGFVRSDLVVKHPETLDFLGESGFVELCSGVESGSERVLKRIQKGTTPEINSRAAELIMDAGFDYKAFTIIGHPSETYDELMKTMNWIKDTKPHGFDISILTPYPGSRIYDHSQDSIKYAGYNREWNGLYFKEVDYSSASSFYKGKPGEYSCNVRTDELSSEDLIQLRDKFESELKNYN